MCSVMVWLDMFTSVSDQDNEDLYQFNSVLPNFFVARLSFKRCDWNAGQLVR